MLRAEAAQRRSPFGEEGPRKKARRLAVAQGFSLHAETAAHAFDRLGLRKLCARAGGEERLTRLPDGRYRWQPKRGPALTLTAPGRRRLSAVVAGAPQVSIKRRRKHE